MRLLRILGLFALAALVALVSLCLTGFNETSRRMMERQNVTSIPADSAFIRSTLAGPLADDHPGVINVVEILRLAGRGADITALQAFVGDCNVRRLLGSDEACRQETIAAAIDKGAALRSPAQPIPASADLEARLADAVSFFVPDEKTLRANAGDSAWRFVRYEGPGLLRYDTPAEGIYLFVAARNRSDWTIRTVEGVLSLRLPGGTSIELQCSSHNPNPFPWRAVQPGGETIAACKRPDNVPIPDLAAAMHAIPPEAPGVRLAGLEIRNPYATVVDHGASANPRFTLAGTSIPDYEDRDQINANEFALLKQLRDMDCHELGNCPTTYEAVAMSVAAPFFDQPLLIPPVIGVLLGVIIGGLVRRSLMLGGAFAALLVLVAVGGIALLFQSESSGSGEQHGFALMALGALTVGTGVAFVVGLPAFFITIALMRGLRSWLEPKAATLPFG